MNKIKGKMMDLKVTMPVSIIGFSLSSCFSNESNGDDLVRKRIIQTVEKEGMGML